MKNRINLGVNIDHAATLRQVRGGTTSYPNLLAIAREAVKGGADSITIHLREDRRHIQLQDLIDLTGSERPAPINLEMAVTDENKRLALKYKPDWICLVPEKRAELTTEGGLNLFHRNLALGKLIERVRRIGIEVSLFIDPDLQQVTEAARLGADAVEFHTGSWVLAKSAKKQDKLWQELVEAAHVANDLQLRVHAGHGLDFASSCQIRKLPYLQEVNIGHSLICYSLVMGLRPAVKKMKAVLRTGRL